MKILAKFKTVALIAVTTIVASLCLTGCSENEGGGNIKKETIVLSRSEQDVVASQYDFSVALLDAALSENEGGNVIFSPLALEMAMNMTAHGMGSESLNELLKVFDAEDLETLDGVNKTFLQKLPACDPAAVTVKMNFSNWQNSNFSFNPAFASSLKDLFDVPTTSVDFTKTDMMKMVNDWANKSTNGLIKQILLKQPDPDVAMILCNSLYFNGKWENPFDKSLTKPHDFTSWDGKTSGQVELMQFPKKSGSLKYHQFDRYRMASIAYGDGLFNLNIYLPEKDCTQQQLIEALKNYRKDWNSGNYESFSAPKALIPKFEFRSSTDITPVLKKTGIDLKDIDLTGISNEISGINVYQHSAIKVDESGTEAALIIAQIGDLASPGPLRVGEDFIVDRPFVYSITGPYGAVLFIGLMSNPGVK